MRVLAALAAVLVACATAGCLHDQLVSCGDGRVCPVDSVCVAGGCASPDDLAACADLADGEPCSSPLVATGLCEAGVCTAHRCGDAIVQELAGESCDDGNTVAGDGCSETCQIEACGDGEPGAGERCDDGNLLSGDGCSPTCTREQPGWEPMGTPSGREEREAMVAEYIPQRGTIVRFAGYDRFGQITSGTFELVGDTWRRVLTLHAPSPRVRAAAAYDPIRQRWVMFGGYSASEHLTNQTWEFDGTDWTQRTIPNPPPAVERHVMVWDPIGMRIVMHCWCTRLQAGVSNTWAYDGTAWTPIASTAEPGARWMAAMAFDVAGQRVVLFGGAGPGGTYNDVWELVGDQWAPVTTNVPAPSARTWHELAWDPARQHLIMDGGGDLDTPDTWELDGATWTELTASPAFARATPVVEAALVFDPMRGHLLRYGGWRGQPVDEAYELHADGWHRIGMVTPGERTSAGIAVDTLRDRLVLFGGVSYWFGDLDDTWTFDGTTWTQLATLARPPATSYSGLAYDSVRDRMVTVAGDGTTWELAGDVWAPVATATPAPPPSPLVYDSARHVVVSYSTDTMEYDGTDWHLVAVTSPPARDGHAMTFDPIRNRVVMFGGDLPGEPPGTTWEYDGSAWTSSADAIAPVPRWGPSMAFDTRRGRIVLVGGEINSGPVNDTWEYDGTWHPLFTDDAYSARIASMTAPRPGVAGGVVQFGGSDYQFTLADTWLLRWK